MYRIINSAAKKYFFQKICVYKSFPAIASRLLLLLLHIIQKKNHFYLRKMQNIICCRELENQLMSKKNSHFSVSFYF